MVERTERRALLVQERLRDVERQRFLDQIQPQPGDAILDVGCSTGRLMKQLRTGHGVQTVWGVDPDSAMHAADVPSLLIQARKQVDNKSS